MKPTGDGYIDWDAGREGYVEAPPGQGVVNRNSKRAVPPAQAQILTIRREERFGSLVAAAGVIWAVYVATKDYDSLWHLHTNPPGPFEICALGILAWLHAKWRRSLKN